jgi:hypothetical protein
MILYISLILSSSMFGQSYGYGSRGGSYYDYHKKYYYYSGQRSSGNITPFNLRLDVHGWQKFLKRTSNLKGFLLRNKMRSDIINNKAMISLKDLEKALKFSPQSVDGIFLKKYIYYKIGKSFSPEKLKNKNHRINLLNIFSSLVYGDVKTLTTHFNSVNKTQKQSFYFALILGNSLKKAGFLHIAYKMYRTSLRALEYSSYQIKLSSSDKKKYLRFIVLTLAEISHKKGEYRKSWGILKWLGKNNSFNFSPKIACSWNQILNNNCKIYIKSNSKNKFISTNNKETEMYQIALTKWTKKWNKGIIYFNEYLKKNSSSPWKDNVTKFVFWLKHNKK